MALTPIGPSPRPANDLLGALSVLASPAALVAVLDVGQLAFALNSTINLLEKGVGNIMFAPNESPHDLFSELFPQHASQRTPFSAKPLLAEERAAG